MHASAWFIQNDIRQAHNFRSAGESSIENSDSVVARIWNNYEKLMMEAAKMK